MKRLLPWLILTFSILWVLSAWRLPKKSADHFDFTTFGKLPVLAGGRAKPLDTVARNSLVILSGKQTVRLEQGGRLSAIEWLALMLFNAQEANKLNTIVITHPEVLGLFGWQQDERKSFSYNELDPFLAKIDEQGQKAEQVEAAKRTGFQTAIYNLRNALVLYQRLQNTLQPQFAKTFGEELDAWIETIPGGLEAVEKLKKKENPDQNLVERFRAFVLRYQDIAQMSNALVVPNPEESTHWDSLGNSVLGAINSGTLNPIVRTYAAMGDAYRSSNHGLFNSKTQELAAWMNEHQKRATKRSDYEFLFNHFAPFYTSMSLYVLAFLLVVTSWLVAHESLNRSAVFILLLALGVHTFGLLSRMYLQGRPPVTNLYSSAIFIGWGTVIIGLILERFFKDGIGAVCSACIGFLTLIIAHHLGGSGDTLEMLQAVLDTNIWLATHVVVITFGYSAMFLAGALAIVYVVRGVFTRTLSKPAAQRLGRMAYGVVCFATLFSFVGTVLGGIWADQSWGRFWGWDPKENGALLIVLWCAIVLHARWGGFVKQRGLMALVIFGNVITSFSWFGVNMLGVGLHSYGFMNKAFPWLLAFMLSQIALIAIALIPLRNWKSQLES